MVVAISLAAALAAAAAMLTPFMQRVESQSVDIRLLLKYWLVGRDGRFGSPEITLLGIDQRSLEHFGQYGAGEWMTRKPFINQLDFLQRHARPSVLAYDIIFSEKKAAARLSAEEGRLESLGTADRLAERLRGLVAEERAVLDLTTLSEASMFVLDQGDTHLRHRLASVAERGDFTALLAYHFVGGAVDPQSVRIPPFSDADVFGDDPAGDEDYGTRVPYLRDAAIPESCLHFPTAGAAVDYDYSPNALLPASSLLDYVMLGYVNVPPDEDGVFRRLPLVLGFEYSNRVLGVSRRVFVPSLALQACLVHLGISLPLQGGPRPPVEVWFGREIVLRSPERGEFRIPIDDQGRMYLNFNARVNDFQTISFADVAPEGAAAGAAVDERFRRALHGHLVAVGLMATATTDIGPCPLDGKTPLVHVHLTAMSNILGRHFLTVLKPWPRRALLAGIVGLFTLIAVSSRASRLIVMAVAVLAVCNLAGYAGVHVDGYVLPVVAPTLYVVFATLGVVFYRYLTEERAKRQVRGMFSTMVSSDVLSYIEEHPESFALSGRDVEATIFYSDIRGFTTIGESLPAHELTRLINAYLTPVTVDLQASRAYVDKYIGDMVMAVWGVPYPNPDHALNACESALRQQQIIRAHNPAWREEYGVEIGVRMGINSGIVTAGNMGSNQRFQFTVMGDVVNQASRFEPMNDRYGTGIIIGEDTRRLAGERMVTRELDRVVVKGKTRPVTVYELVGMAGDVDEAWRHRLAAYEKALYRYYERDWAGAVAGLDALLASGADGPAEFLRKRAMAYAEAPPPDGWRGEYVSVTKH